MKFGVPVRFGLALLLTLAASPLRAEEPFTVTLTIKDHRFDPAEIRVPAGRRILIKVVNQDPMSEEFESTALKAEKVIAGASEGIVRVGALDPGRYAFVGEYHAETAQGVVIAE